MWTTDVFHAIIVSFTPPLQIKSCSFDSIPEHRNGVLLVQTLAKRFKQLSSVVIHSGVMAIENLVPFKFKGMDVRVPFLTMKFEYEAGESGQVNN